MRLAQHESVQQSARQSLANEGEHRRRSRRDAVGDRDCASLTGVRCSLSPQRLSPPPTRTGCTHPRPLQYWRRHSQNAPPKRGAALIRPLAIPRIVSQRPQMAQPVKVSVTRRQDAPPSLCALCLRAVRRHLNVTTALPLLGFSRQVSPLPGCGQGAVSVLVPCLVPSTRSRHRVEGQRR